MTALKAHKLSPFQVGFLIGKNINNRTKYFVFYVLVEHITRNVDIGKSADHSIDKVGLNTGQVHERVLKEGHNVTYTSVQRAIAELSRDGILTTHKLDNVSGRPVFCVINVNLLGVLAIKATREDITILNATYRSKDTTAWKA